MPELTRAGRAVPSIAIAAAIAFGQQSSYINPTRPTISSGAAIQQQGVLQIEAGYDGYFLPYDRTQAVSLYYAATNWLRLDGSVPGWRSTDIGSGNRTSGLGNTSLGAKLVLFRQGRSRRIPGIAVSYEETFPTAPQVALRSWYRDGTLIISQEFGSWVVKLNGSIIADCEHPSGCGLRGQGVMGVTYKATDKTVLAADVFGQTVSVSALPGAYGLFGITRKLRYNFSVNSGLRLGLNESASRIGFTVGITMGLGGRPRRTSP